MSRADVQNKADRIDARLDRMFAGVRSYPIPVFGFDPSTPAKARKVPIGIDFDQAMAAGRKPQAQTPAEQPFPADLAAAIFGS